MAWKFKGNGRRWGQQLKYLYLATLLSYKNLFRVGFGAGFSEYPSGLKNGLTVGGALPSDVANLNDIIDYKRKLSGFLTFSISGITLKK